MSLPQVMTWREGPGVKLTWRAGQRVDATWHWGHVAEPRLAHAGACGADSRGRRPSGRVHVGARVGRHVVGGFASGGPTGIVGPGNSGGTVTLWLCRGAPLFNRKISLYFLRVGLCSHAVLTCAGDVDTTQASDAIGWRRSRGPKSTQSLMTHVRIFSLK